MQPDPKNTKKLLSTLTTHFSPLTHASRAIQKNKGKKSNSGGDDTTTLGEFAGVMEAEMFDFVLFEVPNVQELDGR